MSIEIKIPAKFDKINTNDLGELIWWSIHLGTGPEKLLSVINKVGNNAEEVRKFLWLKTTENTSG